MLLLGLFYALTGGIHILGPGHPLVSGLLFGALAWVAVAAPVLASQSFFVNIHPGVTVGLLLDWLVLCLLAGGGAGWAVRFGGP